MIRLRILFPVACSIIYVNFSYPKIHGNVFYSLKLILLNINILFLSASDEPPENIFFPYFHSGSMIRKKKFSGTSVAADILFQFQEGGGPHETYSDKTASEKRSSQGSVLFTAVLYYFSAVRAALRLCSLLHRFRLQL